MSIRKYGWALVFLLCGILVVLLLDTVSAIREGQQQRVPLFEQTNRAAHAAEEGTRRIEDCTTPGRECYDDGQRRLARTVAGLNLNGQRAAAAAAACALTVEHPTYRAIYQCVRQTAATDKRRAGR